MGKKKTYLEQIWHYSVRALKDQRVLLTTDVSAIAVGQALESKELCKVVNNWSGEVVHYPE